MTTKYISTSDREAWLKHRGKYVTSTEMASLFGIQEGYAPTHFELWHIKHGNLQDTFKGNDYTRFGNLMEEPIAQMVAFKNSDWLIERMDVFAYDETDRIGSSFDRKVTIPGRGTGLLEIKQTDYRTYIKKFTEHSADDIEAPQGYEIQMQMQLILTDLPFLVMAVFLADTRQLRYIYRTKDEEMEPILRKAARDFWNNGEPEPDYTQDKSVIAKLAPKAIEGNILDGNENGRLNDLAAIYKSEKELEKHRQLKRLVPA